MSNRGNKLNSVENDAVLIFVHIPKCGGTTVRRHIVENLPPETYFETAAEVTDSVERVADSIMALPAERRGKVQVVFGHGAYYGIHELFGRPGEYVTLLRDPVDRAISEYNYQRVSYEGGVKGMGAAMWEEKGGVWSFADWLQEYPAFRNGMTRYLATVLLGKERFTSDAVNPHNVSAIKRVLDSFRFVGLTEHDDDFLWLYHRLGIRRFLPRQNVSRRYFTPADRGAIEAMVSEVDALDEELYEYARQLNARQRQEEPGLRSAILLTRLRRWLGGVRAAG
jgi:hypothetical protein